MRWSHRRGRVNTACLLLLCLTGLTGAASFAEDNAQEQTDWRSFFRDAEAKLSFRYRFENVDDDGFSEEAHASTLRSRLTVTSGRVGPFSAFVEIDDLSEIGADSFNAGGGNTPSRTKYPIVADPRGTDLNQVYLNFSTGGWNVRVGRQRINLDNQRFVGGVGWRQNEQTYDAFKLDFETENWNAQYAYVDKVRRIFGHDVPAGTHEQDGTHLLNVSAKINPFGQISGYYYHLDYEDVAAFSTATYGLRLTNLREVWGSAKLRYVAEWARQQDISNNPVGYTSDYWNVEGAVVVGHWDAGIGWEVLEGDDDDPGEAFRTPLATLHAFNGWVDRFLQTPGAGLDDRYAKVKFTHNGFIVQVRFHVFEAADGGTEFGEELNFHVGKKFTGRIRADVHFAQFNGDAGYEDVTKIWFTAALTF